MIGSEHVARDAWGAMSALGFTVAAIALVWVAVVWLRSLR